MFRLYYSVNGKLALSGGKSLYTTRVVKYGLLYNSYAAHDSRNIANTGWHLPSGTELTAMCSDVLLMEFKAIGGRNYSSGEFFSDTTSVNLWLSDFSGELDEYGVWEGFIDSCDAMAAYQNTWGFPIRLMKDDDNDPGNYTGNDGKIYPTVKIGNSVFIKTNLAETKYRRSLKVNYGALYNWYAATDVRLITSSDDWIVPSLADFQELANYLGADSNWTGNIVGKKLKESGTTYWDSPNSDATNEVGFNCRGTGQRSNGFNYIKLYTDYWTTTWMNSIIYATAYLSYNANYFYVSINHGNNAYIGLPIRLLHITTTLSHGEESTYTGNDGRVYRTICIGTQEWLADNLCETKYRDGSTIPEVTGNAEWMALTTGALCYYDNDIDNAYIDDDTIPEVTDNDDWVALTTGALCAYNNDWDNV